MTEGMLLGIVVYMQCFRDFIDIICTVHVFLLGLSEFKPLSILNQ